MKSPIFGDTRLPDDSTNTTMNQGCLAAGSGLTIGQRSQTSKLKSDLDYLCLPNIIDHQFPNHRHPGYGYNSSQLDNLNGSLSGSTDRLTGINQGMATLSNAQPPPQSADSSFTWGGGQRGSRHESHSSSGGRGVGCPEPDITRRISQTHNRADASLCDFEQAPLATVGRSHFIQDHTLEADIDAESTFNSMFGINDWDWDLDLTQYTKNSLVHGSYP